MLADGDSQRQRGGLAHHARLSAWPHKRLRGYLSLNIESGKTSATVDPRAQHAWWSEHQWWAVELWWSERRMRADKDVGRRGVNGGG
jgi:hypothetical protein